MDSDTADGDVAAGDVNNPNMDIQELLEMNDDSVDSSKDAFIDSLVREVGATSGASALNAVEIQGSESMEIIAQDETSVVHMSTEMEYSISFDTAVISDPFPEEQPVGAEEEPAQDLISEDGDAAGKKTNSQVDNSFVFDPELYNPDPEVDRMLDMFYMALEDAEKNPPVEEREESPGVVAKPAKKRGRPRKKAPENDANASRIFDGTGLAELDNRDDRISSLEPVPRAGSEEIGVQPSGDVVTSDVLEAQMSANPTLQCAVANCRNYQNNKADHVFTFPDPIHQFALRKQWLKKINEHCGKIKTLSGVELLKNPEAGVCNQHFVKDDFVSGWMMAPGRGVKYELKKDAVPSVFLNPTDYIPKPVTLKPAGPSKVVKQYASKSVEQPKRRVDKRPASGLDDAEGAQKAKKAKPASDDLRSDEDSASTKSADAAEMTDSLSDDEYVPAKEKTPKKAIRTLYGNQKKMEPVKKIVANTLGRPYAAPTGPPKAGNLKGPSSFPASAKPNQPTASLTNIGKQNGTGSNGQVVWVQTIMEDGTVSTQPLITVVAGPGSQPNIPTASRLQGPKLPVPTAPLRSVASRVPTTSAPVLPAPPIGMSSRGAKTASTSSTSTAAVRVSAAATGSQSTSTSRGMPAPQSNIQQRPNAWKGSRAPSRTVGIQVGPGETGLSDWTEEELKDVLREAQEEILELRHMLENAEIDLTTERTKVAHLEARVAAWIREHFSQMNVDVERIEVMDKLAVYYVDVGKKAEEERARLASEMELFKGNYTRSQKESESFRQQIIELQNNSSRQIDSLTNAKQKAEREYQEVIANLRRQLAETIAAKSLLDWETKDLKHRFEGGPPPGLNPTLQKGRGPRSKKKDQEEPAPQPAQAQNAQQPYYQYGQQAGPSAGYAQASVLQRANTAPVQPVAPVPQVSPRRGRSSRQDSSPQKGGRESSVERAVRYLMSL